MDEFLLMMLALIALFLGLIVEILAASTDRSPLSSAIVQLGVRGGLIVVALMVGSVIVRTWLAS